MAIIGLGGFQVNMRRTGIESHHSHSRDRISASYVPPLSFAGTPTLLSFRPILRLAPPGQPLKLVAGLLIRQAW